MPIITNSLSLPSDVSASAASSERPQPQTVSRLRSRSAAESCLPPRYSTLTGSLPPGVTLDALATVLNDNEADLDGRAPLLSPPRYSNVFQTRSRQTPQRRHRNHSTERDANTTSSPSSSSVPQVHEYHVTGGGKARPWATVKVHGGASARSRSTPRGQKVPRFSGSDLALGWLELNLDTPQNINSVSLSLRGQVITNSYDDGSCTFLDQPIISWTRANGDPRSMILPLRDTSNSSSSRPKKFDGKFSGQYIWPFSFAFPRSIPIPGQHDQGANPSLIPQTLLERETKGSVKYELVLRITHGILRVDSKLHINVVYVPDIQPAPSSILRQLAYSEHRRPPGPQDDALGWFSHPPVVSRGTLFSERNAAFQSTLSLASPRSYTRGTTIPCHLSIQSRDIEGLDALANAECIAVRLVRRVQYYEDAGRSLMSSSGRHKLVFGGSATAVKASADAALAPVIVETMEVENVSWWCNPDASSEVENSNERQLVGEIHLNKELQPSCDFPLFKVSYFVELLPFESPVFKPSGSILSNNGRGETALSQALLSLPITVATLQGEGPLPIPFTKPLRKEPANNDSYFVDHVTAGWRGFRV
ncbi:hypothetical protein GALMADRAFT_54556 [Galerina marginata CBS 339.88]|uniref:Arrestin-like N-terminal domain-containing protein n=1 Tax=Galerina marginata (strain CBS 339.88) TaxID=685588 RepID=A0A067TLQ4_GALM3|nr:hypothetical protein GALMADRAFT_54556 [Galerina marginata CBS 339.88]